MNIQPAVTEGTVTEVTERECMHTLARAHAAAPQLAADLRRRAQLLSTVSIAPCHAHCLDEPLVALRVEESVTAPAGS